MQRKPRIPGAALGLLAFTIGCSGQVADERGAPGPTGPAPGDPARPGAPTPGTPGTQAPAAEACKGGAVDPGPWLLRRLTSREYENTVRDLLGTPAEVLGTVRLHEDGSPSHFDNNVEQQKVTPQHLERYGTLAATVAGEAIASPRRAQIVGCDPAGANRAACTRAFVDSFGKRAYRRPLAAEEKEDLFALAMADTDAFEGMGSVIRALLGSPSFLYRPELGTPAPERPGLRRLGGLELATRLSYLLRGTTPTAELLSRAEQGGLDDVKGLEKTAQELMATPEGKATLQRFAQQWLGLPALATAERNKTKFPAWSEALRASMMEETSRFLDDVLWGTDRDFLRALNARHTFVNAPLAKLYGLPAGVVSGTGWQRVELPPTARRAGLLGHASILTVTGRGDPGLSAIWRGKFVREALLCQDLPPAPADVPPIPMPSTTTSDRDRLQQHRANPACAGCHEMMDPLGFGLDRYDAIGAYRERDDSGAAILARGEIKGEPNAAFEGAVELADRLRAMPQVGACVVSQVRDYALGRNAADSDACLTSSLARTFEASGHDLRSTLVAFVTSDAFRYRR